jgi:phosphotransferase system HPr (HPr) family protein
MKNSRVIVPWREGLHLRQAAKLVHLARLFRSTIFLKCGAKIADLRSIFSIISLSATTGTAIEVEVIGDDEQDAARAVEQVFSISAQDGIFNGSTQPAARQYFPN